MTSEERALISYLGERLAAGDNPTEDDLEGVLDFLDLILPALAEIEDRLPSDTAP